MQPVPQAERKMEGIFLTVRRFSSPLTTTRILWPHNFYPHRGEHTAVRAFNLPGLVDFNNFATCRRKIQPVFVFRQERSFAFDVSDLADTSPRDPLSSQLAENVFFILKKIYIYTCLGLHVLSDNRIWAATLVAGFHFRRESRFLLMKVCKSTP